MKTYTIFFPTPEFFTRFLFIYFCEMNIFIPPKTVIYFYFGEIYFSKWLFFFLENIIYITNI